jgi:hypothetical protein
MAVPGESQLPHFPVDPSRLGEPLTYAEFEQGYKLTEELAEQAIRRGDKSEGRRLAGILDDTATEHYAHYQRHLLGDEYKDLVADLPKPLRIMAVRGLQHFVGRRHQERY